MSLENSPLPIYLVGDGHLSSFLKPLLNQEFQTFGRQGKDYFFDLDQLDQFTPPEKKRSDHLHDSTAKQCSNRAEAN